MALAWVPLMQYAKQNLLTDSLFEFIPREQQKGMRWVWVIEL
jgi:hypothetical protein